MILLNDDSIYVGQIKQLLNSFELPRCSVYDPSIPYVKGQHYIKDGAVWVVTDNKGTSKEISLYSFGDKVDGITSTSPISNALYDSKTHAYLGNYLRFIRDFVGMDLMGLYNCNAYDMPSSMSKDAIENGYKIAEFSTKDSRYSLIMVPVRWGKRYTIAIDYHGQLEMACIHFDNNTPLDIQMLDGTYKRVSGTRFNHPFLYEMPQCPDDGDTKEETLKLMLKVPSSCNSSIIILEGDFRKCSMSNMYMADNAIDGLKLGDALCWHSEAKGKDMSGPGNSFLVTESDDYDALSAGNSFVQSSGIGLLVGESQLALPSDSNAWNFDYVTKSQLLSMNLGSKALLADRLVEYLSLQAISPMDEVVDNIKRLQRTLEGKYEGYSIKSYGKWDDSMRKTIYNYNWTSGLIHKREDMLAYFDKDVESKIGGLASKHKDSSSGSGTFAQGTIGGR